MTRVLILPGDIRRNIGDTAICLGVVALVRAALPGAEVAVWGYPPAERGAFGEVRFPRAEQMSYAAAVRQADLVVWGGGQLLQSNRSLVKVPFWALRIGLARALGGPVVGVGQGIGPLPGRASQCLAARLVRLAAGFSVRDQRSRDLMAGAGAPVDLGADPALVHCVDRPAKPAGPAAAGRETIGVALRYTLHHRARRVVPFQMLPEARRAAAFETDEFRAYEAGLIDLMRRLRAETGAALRLLPLYAAPWETDLRLASSVTEALADPDVSIHPLVEGDVNGLLEEMDGMEMVISTPMHGTILSTARQVPTFGLNYEDKGRDYMASIGQARWCAEAETVMTEAGRAALLGQIMALWAAREETRADLAGQIAAARERAEVPLEALRRAAL